MFLINTSLQRGEEGVGKNLRAVLTASGQKPLKRLPDRTRLVITSLKRGVN